MFIKHSTPARSCEECEKEILILKNKPRRYQVYRLVHLAALLYFALAGWQRLSLALTSRSMLEEVGLYPGPLYLSTSGLSWCVLGLTAAGLILVSRTWAYRTVFGLSTFFALSYWLDRLVLTRSDNAHANWPFALFATLLLLAFSASLMIVLSKQDFSHANKQRSGN